MQQENGTNTLMTSWFWLAAYIEKRCAAQVKHMASLLKKKAH